MQKSPPFGHHQLIGSPEENLYQLGLKDQEGFENLRTHMMEILFPIPKSWQTRVLDLVAPVLRFSDTKTPLARSWLKAYGEGLGISWEEVLLTYYLPDLMSSFDWWAPPNFPMKNLGLGLFGCSSFFHVDSKTNTPLHGRILDFPLGSTYTDNERAITYKFNGLPQVFSLSTAGIGLASLTVMNEYGVTAALHQKFSSEFNPRGSGIFELVHEYIFHVTNLQEAISWCKDKTSLSSWGLYSSFKSGEVIEIDFLGNTVEYRVHSLGPEKGLYFNNQPINQNRYANMPRPLNFSWYNDSRLENAKHYLDNLDSQKNRSTSSMLKAIAKAPNLKKRDTFSLAPVTVSSLVSAVLGPCNQEACYITGEVPRESSQSHVLFKNIWSKAQLNETGPKANKVSVWAQANRHLSKAQIALDRKDLSAAYHHMQMALTFDLPKSHLSVWQFFFLAIQFCQEKQKRALRILLKDFQLLKDRLPTNLEFHRLLFITRIEKILGLEKSFLLEDINSTYFHHIYSEEKRIPGMILHSLLSRSIQIRLDLIDIIYLHSRPTPPTE